MLIQLLATWIPALLIGLSGVLKLTGKPKILETMTALGVGRHVRLLGVTGAGVRCVVRISRDHEARVYSCVLLFRRGHCHRTVA
jgi:hypothetical protein